jgi:hypothetical protein
LLCFDFNQRPQYSFQIPLIANRLSPHKNNFDFGFQQKNRFLNALWSYRNFYKKFHILFGYFRGLKLKQEKRKQKKKGIARKVKGFSRRTEPAESGPAGQPPRPHRPARQIVCAAGPSKPAAQPALFFLFFFFSLSPDGWDPHVITEFGPFVPGDLYA